MDQGPGGDAERRRRGRPSKAEKGDLGPAIYFPYFPEVRRRASNAWNYEVIDGRTVHVPRTPKGKKRGAAAKPVKNSSGAGASAGGAGGGGSTVWVPLVDWRSAGLDNNAPPVPPLPHSNRRRDFVESVRETQDAEVEQRLATLGHVSRGCARPDCTGAADVVCEACSPVHAWCIQCDSVMHNTVQLLHRRVYRATGEVVPIPPVRGD